MLSAGLFIFRPFTENDAPSFAEAVRESGATVGKWMSWAHADYAESDALTWFELCARDRANGTSHEFGIFDAGSQTLVGGCGLNQFNLANGFCNLGYWVRQSWQRRGAALAAIQALSRYAFVELQQGRVEIVVAAGNTPSLALAAKAGALHECLARAIASNCTGSSPMRMSSRSFQSLAPDSRSRLPTFPAASGPAHRAEATTHGRFAVVC